MFYAIMKIIIGDSKGFAITVKRRNDMGKLVKKTGLLMLILALVLSFSGCGKKKTADESW